MKLKDIELGDLVVVSKQPDATIFCVTEKLDVMLGIKDTSLVNRQHTQFIDYTYALPPTNEQLTTHIKMNMKLV